MPSLWSKRALDKYFSNLYIWSLLDGKQDEDTKYDSDMVEEPPIIPPSILALEYGFMDQHLGLKPRRVMCPQSTSSYATNNNSSILSKSNHLLAYKNFNQLYIRQERGHTDLHLLANSWGHLCANLIRESFCICIYATWWVPPHDIGTKLERDITSCLTLLK